MRFNVRMATKLRGVEHFADVTVRRAPPLLRFVWKAGKGKKIEWDALDQLDDAVRPGESVIVGVIDRRGWRYHLKGSGSVTGYYEDVHYRLFDPQPDYLIVRDNDRWQAWCFEQKRLGKIPQPRYEHHLPAPPSDPMPAGTVLAMTEGGTLLKLEPGEADA